jgi:hypothetical protein
LSSKSKRQTELAASHRAFALQASPFQISVQSTLVAQAGAFTQPFSMVQYRPAEHAVAPLLGPIECAHVPALHVSIVQENPSSQDLHVPFDESTPESCSTALLP